MSFVTARALPHRSAAGCGDLSAEVSSPAAVTDPGLTRPEPVSTLVQSPIDAVAAACCPGRDGYCADEDLVTHRDKSFTDKLRAPRGAHQLEEC
ncbi:hypothetical protein NWFMUON74_71620 [Nocardia wallacei]|uniref:Uncharacterized protein n=1 Tax=Nocardia wallacei TaxID=480035 RepID=A0A7G1KVV0_9NOCA|nr:hypothetical protein NWFMUON74_71620 [Nocardia wallacei]